MKNNQTFFLFFFLYFYFDIQGKKSLCYHLNNILLKSVKIVSKICIEFCESKKKEEREEGGKKIRCILPKFLFLCFFFIFYLRNENLSVFCWWKNERNKMRWKNDSGDLNVFVFCDIFLIHFGIEIKSIFCTFN